MLGANKIHILLTYFINYNYFSFSLTYFSVDRNTVKVKLEYSADPCNKRSWAIYNKGVNLKYNPKK